MAEAGPWDRAQAVCRNGFAGDFATAIGSGANASEGSLDIVEDVLFGGQAAERKIVIEVIGGRVRRISGVFESLDDGSRQFDPMFQQSFAHLDQRAIMPVPTVPGDGCWFGRRADNVERGSPGGTPTERINCFHNNLFVCPDERTHSAAASAAQKLAFAKLKLAVALI